MSGLTAKQQLFIDAYLKTWNAVEAARQAGYKGSYQTLGVIGWENLKKPKIAAKIKERLAISAMSADEALSRLGDMARANIGDYIDEHGIIDWKAVKKAGHLFKEVGHLKGKSAFKMHDSQAALIQILRVHGAFVQKIEQKVEIENIGDEARVDRITDLLEAARERRDQSTSNDS